MPHSPVSTELDTLSHADVSSGKGRRPDHRQDLTTVGWIAAALIGGAAFSLLTVLVVLRLTGGVDEVVQRAALTLRFPALTAIETTITDLGSYRFVLVEAAVLALITAWVSRRVLPPFVLLAAVASTSSLEYLIKIATGRPRPPADLALGAPATDSSFPSGHTTSGSTVFLLGAVLIALHLHRRLAARLVLIAGIAVSTAIGLSRVYLGYHWFSDVLGGWLLASTLTAVAVAALGLVLGQPLGTGVDSNR